MAFRIEWKKSTRKDLRKLPPRVVDRIVEAVESLADEPFPFGSEKLQGSEHAYRIRMGDYRVVLKSLSQPSLSKSSACGTGKMFTGVEMISDARSVTTKSKNTQDAVVS